MSQVKGSRGDGKLHPFVADPKARRISVFERFESFVWRLRRLFVQDLPFLVTTHSRVLFLVFHAYYEVLVQSSPIDLGLQLAYLI